MLLAVLSMPLSLSVFGVEPADALNAAASTVPASGESSPAVVVPAPAELPAVNRDFGGKTRIGPMAQFQLPPASIHGGPPRPVIQFLKYQYSYGSESDITYLRDPDLDRRLRDNSLVMAPQVNGYVIYRPNSSIEMMLEMILEREFALQEEDVVHLPSGETQINPKRRTSLLVDQAWLRFKSLGPFDLTVGRRNFEDDRHWLYDTSLDTAFVRFRQGALITELSASRKEMFDLDLLRNVPRGRINNYMLYLDYRGLDSIRLAGYAIQRHDSDTKEGRPLHLGLRAYGMPTDSFNFWSELALLRGRDEANQRFDGVAVDLGGTYRFLDLPWRPSLTLGYANGSGDGNPRDRRNTEFRQTGLQSNEFKMAGVSKFKYYGEVFDPELSNLQILTASLGFRPQPSVYVELVYHQYRLNKIADSVRNSALTAQMSQVDTQLSKKVGSELDLVVGLRNLFGIRRLGVDMRFGWFRPGKAFVQNDGDDENPALRRADKALGVVVKFWF